MRNRKLAVVMAAVLAGGTGSFGLLTDARTASAQVSISVNTNFNPQTGASAAFSGSIRPVDGRSYITTGNLQRGMAYIPATATTPARLAVVNRSGSTSINLINPFTGADAGTLNVDPSVVTGGNFLLNTIAATSDGVIYAANLVVGVNASAPFKVYRWSSINAAPTLYYSGTADQANAGFGSGISIRIGDSIALTPGPDGSGGRLGFGWGNNGGANPNITFTTIPTGQTPIATPPTTPAYSVITSSSSPYQPIDDFRLGFTFSSQTNVFMRGTGNSTLYYGSVTNGPAPVGTYNAGPDSAFPSTQAPSAAARQIGYLSANGNQLLASVDGNSNIAYVLDVSNPASTTLLGQARVIGDANGQNGNGTGAVAWGEVTNAPSGRVVPLYTLNTNSGISAFTVGVPVTASYAVDANGSYTATGSWTGGLVPNFAGDIANFGPVITAPRTVTLSETARTGSVTFNNTNAYTIAGTGILRIQSANTVSTTGTITVTQGNHSIQTPIQLGNVNTTVSVAATSTLTVASISGNSTSALIMTGNGVLRVTNVLDVGRLNFGGATSAVNLAPGAGARFSDPGGTTGTFNTALDRVVFQTVNGGSSGIKVSANDVSPSAPYAIAVFRNEDPKRPGNTYFSSYKGLSLSSTDTLAVTTYAGDTNLDGRVDGADLANILESLYSGATGWLSGDVNLTLGTGASSNSYLGTVDVTDLAAYYTAKAAYDANPVPLSLGLELAGNVVTGAVPEPAGLAVVPVLAAVAMRRRRK